MNNYLTCNELFSTNKIVPVVVLNDTKKALDIAQALVNGGIKIIEVTLRTPNALKIIEVLRQNLPQITVGAGTIINDDQYHLAIKHGAQFIVSPGLSSDLINVSSDYDAPYLPGAITPTEILNAYAKGFSYLKYFPAESYNGLSSLKSIASVFPEIKFCPTGGINLTNVQEYLALPNVVAIGCSFLVTEAMVISNDFDRISEIAKQLTTLSNQP